MALATSTGVLGLDGLKNENDIGRVESIRFDSIWIDFSLISSFFKAKAKKSTWNFAFWFLCFFEKK